MPISFECRLPTSFEGGMRRLTNSCHKQSSKLVTLYSMMKTSLKDHLPLLVALVAIFVSGYGVGFLLGKKKGQLSNTGPAYIIPDDHHTGVWKKEMLEDLSTTLELNRRQKKLAAEQIQLPAEELGKVYYYSTRSILTEQLKLMDPLMPLLNEDQLALMQERRDQLAKAIEEKFES